MRRYRQEAVVNDATRKVSDVGGPLRTISEIRSFFGPTFARSSSWVRPRSTMRRRPDAVARDPAYFRGESLVKDTPALIVEEP